METYMFRSREIMIEQYYYEVVQEIGDNANVSLAEQYMEMTEILCSCLTYTDSYFVIDYLHLFPIPTFLSTTPTLYLFVLVVSVKTSSLAGPSLGFIVKVKQKRHVGILLIALSLKLEVFIAVLTLFPVASRYFLITPPAFFSDARACRSPSMRRPPRKDDISLAAYSLEVDRADAGRAPRGSLRTDDGMDRVEKVSHWSLERADRARGADLQF